MQRIDIDDDEVDMDPAQRLLYRGELFTGEAEELQAGVRISLDTYTDGILDGPTREWYRDGTPRSAGTMRMGFPSGEFLQWHPNGQLAVKKIHTEDGKILLAEYAWDAEGRQTKEWHRAAE